MHLRSLRATYKPGVLNRGADFLSRGNPLYADLRLHSEVVKQTWFRYGQVTVDLYASVENAQCPHDQTAPLEVDAIAHKWLKTLLYTFPSVGLILLALAKVRREDLFAILIPENTGW